MFIERHQFSERGGRQTLCEDRVRWPIAIEDTMRRQPVGRTLGLHLGGGLAEGKGFGLREDIREQHVMMAAQRGQGLDEADEIARDEARALMNQLVEGMLAIGTRLAPIDGASVAWNFLAVEHY